MARRSKILSRLAVSLAFVAGVVAAQAGERRPVPAFTIYPNDIIRDQMLTDAEFPNAIASSSFATNRTMLVGKMAKRTLLPGQPIPTNAIGEPRLVTVGAMVRLVYTEGGLTIATYGAALQPGALGDMVSARNRESGVTVSGIVQQDGSILVGGG